MIDPVMPDRATTLDNVGCLYRSFRLAIGEINNQSPRHSEKPVLTIKEAFGQQSHLSFLRHQV